MKYRLRETRIIHWDDEDILQRGWDPSAVIQRGIAGEIYKIHEEKELLPIGIETHVKVLSLGRLIFNCIFHTQGVVKFDKGENPINDLIAMLDAISLQEQYKWNEATIGTDFNSIDIMLLEGDGTARFNKAYEIMEAGRRGNIL